ncbi:MAG: hypothetical protein A3K19_29555 [Lentisphaerae bacterium RIFOXYB12_FULL_65_16]|nr:MAG: hypothetical protein A3K18_29935 [Lentisphaerae bacterium RIFOXYA12_64_32]OGV87055.1 MAG: hypothetical protein A3K19_29555 [Lentisphaerae bacterium RIFOXYB12_FULL_65_16]
MPAETRYFAQITDIHVGENNLNGAAARRNLAVALEEIAALSPTPACILATADLACCGRRAELEQYVSIAKSSKLPIHALPANHDLWGERDDAVWTELLGPCRQTVDVGDLRLVLFQDLQRKPGGGWHARVDPEMAAWLESQLAAWPNGKSAVVFHAPILEEAGDYHDNWKGTNAPEFLELMRRHEVQALITGHWHRVNEWRIGGVRLINSGALCGWQWTGIPPYWSFPVRAGYMLYSFDGQTLRSFWRELYSQEMRPEVQVNLVWVGPVHTGGPRPQVRPAEVFSRLTLTAHTCRLGGPVDAVEWSLCNGQWLPMRCTYHGIWQEWQAELDPHQFRAGEQVLSVRALLNGTPKSYDAVPVRLAEASSPPLCAAIAGREQVFELFYTPK